MPTEEAVINLDSADGRKPKTNREFFFARKGDRVEWVGGHTITGKWSVIFKGQSPFSRSAFSGERGGRDGAVAVRQGGFKYDIEHTDSQGDTKHDPIIVIRSSDPLTSDAEEVVVKARFIAAEADVLAQMVEGLFLTANNTPSIADVADPG